MICAFCKLAYDPTGFSVAHEVVACRNELFIINEKLVSLAEKATEKAEELERERDEAVESCETIQSDNSKYCDWLREAQDKLSEAGSKLDDAIASIDEG